jgi:hypothetical protein
MALVEPVVPVSTVLQPGLCSITVLVVQQRDVREPAALRLEQQLLDQTQLLTLEPVVAVAVAVAAPAASETGPPTSQVELVEAVL